MSSSKNSISIDDMSIVLSSMLDTYSAEVEEKVEEIAVEVAKQAVNDLKVAGTYKSRNYQNKSGKYAFNYRKSFKYTKRVIKNVSGKEVKITIYNKKAFLTHLLEYGHVTRDGVTRAREFPHFDKVKIETERNFERKLKEEL